MKPNPTQTLVAFCLLLAVCCLLPSAIFAQSAEALPQGLWKVAQITIEKNTDGKLETMVYNTVAELQSHLPCPQELEVNAQNIVLRYADGREAVPEYLPDSNQLTIITAGVVLQYRYSIAGENLTLISTYEYLYNRPAEQIERIEEKCTIILMSK